MVSEESSNGEHIERKTLNQILETYSGVDSPVNIAFGIRPSGTIHLGNMMTMALASGLGREIGPHLASLDVTICDLDLPDQSDWNIHKTGYAKHYRDIPDPASCHATVSDHAKEDIERFLDILKSQTGVRYRMKTLTEVQRTPAFREGLKRVLDDASAMKLILPNTPDKSVWVYPLCPSCGGSYTGTMKGRENEYSAGKISTLCSNPDCEVGDFEVDVLDTTKDLAVHLFIDPLRDGVIEPFANIHVFGGDYSLEHGDNKIPKFEKIRRIMRLASPAGHVPDILIGSLVYARDGSKMSKSKSNGLTADHLRGYCADYPARILDFTMDALKKGRNNIDSVEFIEFLAG